MGQKRSHQGWYRVVWDEGLNQPANTRDVLR